MKNIHLAVMALCFSLPLAPISQPHAVRTTANSSEELFEANDVLNFQLNGNIRELLDDRGNTPSLHKVTITYMGKDNHEVSVPIEAKTRGHFRKAKENCSYPPLLLSFSTSDAISASLFAGQHKLKLVMPCKDDVYVIREWLVYKLYNLISPESFRARLVKVTLNDTQKKKQYATQYGILLEEESQVAERNHEVLLNKKMQRPQQMESNSFMNMAIFQYMIGNTDWSIQYLQNIKLLAPDSAGTPKTVPYDFDHAGIVSTPYALPAEELQMSSVRERRYRGYCVSDMKKFDGSIALFNRLKEQFYAVYTGCNLLEPKYIKNTTDYLDAFYKTINNPKELKKEFGYPCDPNGTGNVVIKGLKED